MGNFKMLQLSTPVIGILRGVEEDFFGELLGVAFAAGLQALEVTSNTPGAERMVARFRPGVAGNKLLGMGTIRNLAEAQRAVAAGAMFLVSPNCDREVIGFANDQRVPIISGALTPSEVYRAFVAGAEMVKVFPCGALGGPRYIADLRGPFEQIPLVAVGGVTSHNAGEYLAAGAAAVGVGGSLFGTRALAEQDLTAIDANIREFIARLQSAGGRELHG
ncbi:bifunctional 4-hydroxy-2-oxoglutarate aldolase/2-dehydro-3-deoxy-phosphogluconate aldolase [Desulfurivibrio sp. D14AmB]|uniref:bifunctional 4-hydroxy-2-oxoglutarate aldolase/2-dehydro-3-deoxy-phosphogluconate aldolase n=1 Tax=Desulfurivibrio sp. D14AmB TaxID=3374370 RepID=UPI00376EC0B2